MKTLVDYRHRAARMLVLYRWKCKFYSKQHNDVVYDVHKHIFICYKQICLLFEIGLISYDCVTRAYKMYAIIRNKYYRGVNIGYIK